MEQPIIEGKYQIKKMDMKGGWSYVLLPPVHTKSGLPFGWYIVKGKIDSYEIQQYKLWPTADNHLFLPIKAAIRKSIRKQEGDTVEVILFEDRSEIVIPEEFILCLQESKAAWQNFELMSDTSKKQYVDYVYSAKSADAKANRIVRTIEKLELGLKYHQKINP
jgi:hypothetical protein